MVNLFLKEISLTNLCYLSFTIAGLLNISGKRLVSLFMAYQWVNLRAGCIMTVTELFVGSREIQDVVSTLSTAVIVILVFLKSLCFNSRSREIKNLFERLERIRKTMLNDDRNKHFLINAEKFGRIILPPIFLILAGYPYPSFLLNTILDYMSNFKEKNLFLKAWTPWGRETVTSHILSHALIAHMASLFLSIYAAFYFFEITFTLYVSAYIKTLHDKLIHEGIRNKTIFENHKFIIQLIRDYNEILSEQMYIETIISPLMPCGYGLVFLKALQKKEISQMIDNFLRAILCLMPSFVSCGCGQEIITQMERLHEVTYMSNWYEQEPKIRRDLLIMMTRTAYQTTVNYRLFVTYNHDLLTAVLKVIYSYFMLMVNLDE